MGRFHGVGVMVSSETERARERVAILMNNVGRSAVIEFGYVNSRTVD